VSADIYDNRTGRCVLIPRDSTVFGKLSDEVQYGQRRQQAVWTMLILPNGSKLPLMGMDATDGAGRAGITAAVNNHYGRLAGAALAATALDVLGSLGRSNNSGTQINIGGAAADNAASIGERIIQRELNVQPTLEQAIGHPVSLMVDRTITMECYNG
jgi:type IV secretion system protein TrbI